MRIASALVLVALLVWWSWPASESAVRFPDSIDYLRWPEASKPDGVSRLGPRMPAYPLLLRIAGIDAGLVQLQTWLSLAAFCLLGFVLAGPPGLALGGLLSLAPEIHVFCSALLSESLTLSLLALLVAIGLLLARHWRPWLFACWSLGALCFGLLRPGNAAILPFLLAPLLAQLHDLQHFVPLRAGLSPHWRRFVAAALVAGSVAFSGVWLAERSEFWRMNYQIAMMERVVPSTEAREYFRQRGMPTPVGWGSDEFARWFDAHGRASYEGWVISRLESHREAWRWLLPAHQREEILRRYADPATAEASGGAGGVIAGLLYRLAAWPRPLWLAILLLPLLEWHFERRLGPLSLFAAALVPGAYLQCFLAYHASGAEEVRHTLAASLMYRLACLLALVRLGQLWLARRTGGVPATSR